MHYVAENVFVTSSLNWLLSHMDLKLLLFSKSVIFIFNCGCMKDRKRESRRCSAQFLYSIHFQFPETSQYALISTATEFLKLTETVGTSCFKWKICIDTVMKGRDIRSLIMAMADRLIVFLNNPVLYDKNALG